MKNGRAKRVGWVEVVVVFLTAMPDARSAQESDPLIALKPVLTARDDALTDLRLVFAVDVRTDENPNPERRFEGTWYASGEKLRLEITLGGDHILDCWDGNEFARRRKSVDETIVERGSDPSRFYAHANLPHMFGWAVFGVPISKWFGEGRRIIVEGRESIGGTDCMVLDFLYTLGAREVLYARGWLDDSESLLLCRLDLYQPFLPNMLHYAELPKRVFAGDEFVCVNAYTLETTCDLGEVRVPKVFRFVGYGDNVAKGYEAKTQIHCADSFLGTDPDVEFKIAIEDGVYQLNSTTGRIYRTGSATREGILLKRLASEIELNRMARGTTEGHPWLAEHDPEEFLDLGCADIALLILLGLHNVEVRHVDATLGLTEGSGIHDRTLASVAKVLSQHALAADVQQLDWDGLLACTDPVIGLLSEIGEISSHYAAIYGVREGRLELYSPEHNHSMSLSRSEFEDIYGGAVPVIGAARPQRAILRTTVTGVGVVVVLLAVLSGLRERRARAEAHT